MTEVSVGRRVVMFDPGCFLPYYVDALCRSLSALGVRARVIASPPLFEPVDPQGAYDVERFFFPFLRGAARALVRRRRFTRQAIKALSYPFGLFRTWRALRDGPPGVFHLQWAPVPVLDRLLVRALRRRGWRIVYTVHDPLPGPKRRTALRYHRALLGLVDAAIVHTAQQHHAVTEAAPEIAGRVRVIPHGGARVSPPNAADRARSRERLRVHVDRPLLLAFGLIKPYKGLEYLLAAMPNVVARFPDVLLVIAGEPLMPLARLERQIDTLGLRDHVSLRPGFVPTSDVSTYLHAADLLVAPYVSIGASGVVVMAQAHGLPSVVTRVGGLPEFVEPDACGVVVPPRSSAALADAIGRALGDREALARMGDRARRRLARDNDWSDVAERTIALYEATEARSGRDTPDRAAESVLQR
jgi:glycosyltransferase involved in cell wall biosynthesis